MAYEKEYYKQDRCWNDNGSVYNNNIDKVNITFNFIREDVEPVLDAACGNGFFTNMLVQ